MNQQRIFSALLTLAFCMGGFLAPVADARTSLINEKAAQEVRWKIGAPLTNPILAEDAVPDAVTIEGPAEASQGQMVDFIKKRNPKPKLTCTVEELVTYYYEEAGSEGIRADIALCQALKETGFFNYGGDVLPKQNNFCGLGATGNKVKGASFPTAREGVRAHIQHLMVYQSTQKPSQKIIDPRYEHVVKNRPDIHGKIKRWTGLNGVWAVPGTSYGQDILKIWRAAKAPDASDGAKAAADERVKHSPDDASAFVYRGIVFFERGNFKEAEQDFTHAAKLAPKMPEATYNRALLKAKKGDFKGAQKDYERTVKIEPKFTQGWYNLALMQLKNKDYAHAEESFQTVLKLNPQMAEAENAIGIVHIRQKKYSDAWQNFTRAAEIQTTNENALANKIIFEACTME